ncbi:MAG TPA: glycosyltransferase family 4 protein [Ignavibacteria bacterium]
MKVLHLHPRLNIDCGITEIIYQIASDSTNNRNFVLTFGGSALNKFKKKNIKAAQIGDGSSSKQNIIANINFIKNFIKENSINIIHSHHRYFDILAYILSRNQNIKTVTSVQSIVKGLKFLSYKADTLIVPSIAVKEHLISYFKKDESKIKVIYNTIDLSKVEIQISPDELKKKIGINKYIFIVGFAGRLDFEEKGVDILLKAFKKFNRKNQNSKLVLIGKGKNEKLVNKFISDNNLPAIVINPVDNIYDYLNIFNILVLPSRIDPFPLTMLSCGAAKVPFIGSSVNGIKELIKNEHNGLLFECNNIFDLSEKMEKYYSDKKLAESCAVNLRNEVMKNYTSDNYLKQLNEIYLS